MLGNVVYLAALCGPEIGASAEDIAGSLVEKVGKRLAAGMLSEIGNKSGLGGIAKAAIDNAAAWQMIAGGATKERANSLDSVLACVLKGEGVELVRSDELLLLKEMAVAVASGADSVIPLGKLQTYYQQHCKEKAI